MLTNQVFKPLSNMNRAYFGLRQQYQKCARADFVYLSAE
jgi:hypothetical protein